MHAVVHARPNRFQLICSIALPLPRRAVLCCSVLCCAMPRCCAAILSCCDLVTAGPATTAWTKPLEGKGKVCEEEGHSAHSPVQLAGGNSTKGNASMHDEHDGHDHSGHNHSTKATASPAPKAKSAAGSAAAGVTGLLAAAAAVALVL
jgi:hypothetical protein